MIELCVFCSYKRTEKNQKAKFILGPIHILLHLIVFVFRYLIVHDSMSSFKTMKTWASTVHAMERWIWLRDGELCFAVVLRVFWCVEFEGENPTQPLPRFYRAI